MPSEIDELIRVLNEHLAVKDNRGCVVLQVAMIATVYFEEAYRREAREAILACCDDYFERYGTRLRWALNPDTEYPEPFGKSKGSDPHAWLPALEEDEGFTLIYHGGEQADSASPFSLEAFGTERRPYVKLGYFKVTFPLLSLAENPGMVPDVLLEICRKLKPVSGYGGIGIIESQNTSISSEYAPVVYSWSQRLPGLEADYPIEHAIWLGEGREDGRGGIKGVNWLTVISDRWLAELGGADVVAGRVTALDPRFIIHRFDGGLMIQAGPRPTLGDAERGVWPELYVKLAKYLKPIRITQTCPFQYGGPGERFDRERSEAWLRRFDGR